MAKSDWKGIFLLFRIREYAELEEEANSYGMALYKYLHILIDAGRQAYLGSDRYKNMPDFDSVFSKEHEE